MADKEKMKKYIQSQIDKGLRMVTVKATIGEVTYTPQVKIFANDGKNSGKLPLTLDNVNVLIKKLQKFKKDVLLKG